MKKRIQDIWIKQIRDDSSLSKAAKQFALALYQYSDNDTGICWPSEANLYDHWGIGRKVFRDGKDELVSASYLKYDRGNSSKANTYELLIRSELTVSRRSKRTVLDGQNLPSNYSSSSYITTLKGEDIKDEEVIEVIEDYGLAKGHSF